MDRGTPLEEPSTSQSSDGADAEQNRAASPNKDVQRKSTWRNALQNFSAIWFTLVMNTSSLAVIMHNLPYQFNGLGVLATIMYIFSIVLFVSILSVFILRLCLFPRLVRQKTSNSIQEAGMWSAAPIAFLTITALTALIASTASWGGHAFSMVAYVMWWFGTVWMFITSESSHLLH